MFQIQNQFVPKTLNMVGLNIKTKSHAGKIWLNSGNECRDSHKSSVSTTHISKWYILYLAFLCFLYIVFAVKFAKHFSNQISLKKKSVHLKGLIFL